MPNKGLLSDVKFVTNLPVDDPAYLPLAEVLRQKLSDPDIRNLGIVGPYGSGKSSLLKTFNNEVLRVESPINDLDETKRVLDIETTLTISAASLCTPKEKTDASPSSDTSKKETVDTPKAEATAIVDNYVSDASKSDDVQHLRADVERQIVTELLLSKPLRDVPESTLKFHYRYRHRVLIMWFALFFCLVFGVLCYLRWNNLIPLPNSRLPYLYLFDLLVSGVLGVAFLVFFFLSYPPHKLTLSSKYANVEAEVDNDESKFDLYISDLVYFFRKTKTNLVIFEDIDRIQDPSLLTDLRALNLQLNMCKEMQGPHSVVFVYCVNSSCFHDSELQTKFFDFTISPIPVLSDYNAAEHFWKSPLLNPGDDPKETDVSVCHPSLGCVLDLSLFVKDQRMANTILNDYAHFAFVNKNQLQFVSDANAMFALSMYKNLFPLDYDRLLKQDHKNCQFFLRGSDDSKTESINLDNTPGLTDFIDTLRSNHYLVSPFLQYVSKFDGGLFQDEVSKNLYERISHDAPFSNEWVSNMAGHPEKVLEALPTGTLKRLSALNFSLFEVLFHEAQKTPLLKEWRNDFVSGFGELQITHNLYDHVQFLKLLFAAPEKVVDSKSKLAFCQEVTAIYPSFFTVLIDKDIWREDPTLVACILKYVFSIPNGATFLAKEKEAKLIRGFFLNAPDSLSLLSGFSYEQLAFLFRTIKVVIQDVRGLQKGQLSDVLLQYSAFLPTFSNYCAILSSIFDFPSPALDFLTCISQIIAGPVGHSCEKYIASILNDGLSTPEAFSQEKEEGIIWLSLAKPQPDETILSTVFSRCPKGIVHCHTQLSPAMVSILFKCGLYSTDFQTIQSLDMHYSNISPLLPYYFLTLNKEPSTSIDSNKNAFLQKLIAYANKDNWKQMVPVFSTLHFPSFSKLPESYYGALVIVSSDHFGGSLLLQRYSYRDYPEMSSLIDQKIGPITSSWLETNRVSLRDCWHLYFCYLQAKDVIKVLNEYVFPFSFQNTYQDTCLSFPRSACIALLDKCRKLRVPDKKTSEIIISWMKNASSDYILDLFGQLFPSLVKNVKMGEEFSVNVGSVAYYVLQFLCSDNFASLFKLSKHTVGSKCFFKASPRNY